MLDNNSKNNRNKFKRGEKMNFHDLARSVMSRDKGVKNNAAQINEIVSLTLSEIRGHIVSNPVSGVFNVIKLIYKARK